MKLKIKRGTTSKIIRLFIQDSSQATGAGLTGLTSASSGLTAYYIREGDVSATAITLASGTVGTWSSGGFKEVDSTNMPGLYELGLPNAALASGSTCVVMLKGATNMVATSAEIELDAVDYQSATGFITAINSIAPPTNWNSMAIDSSGRVTLGAYASGQDPATLVLDATASGHNTTGTVGAKINTAASGSGGSDPWSTALPGSYASGTAGYLLATNLNAKVGDVKAKTDNLPSSPAAVGSAMTLDMTQAVPTSNTAQTVGDALNAARAQGFGKWVLSGTSLTLYAPDGTTVVRTFTLDSASAPTTRS